MVELWYQEIGLVMVSTGGEIVFMRAAGCWLTALKTTRKTTAKNENVIPFPVRRALEMTDRIAA